MSVQKETPGSPKSLRLLHGRLMNSETYGLPSDTPEMQRLALQHKIWTLMAGGLYPEEAGKCIESALRKAAVERRSPKVLDIGSGSGCWAVQMAEKYPEATIYGFDLEQSRPRHVPRNCRFKAGDALSLLEKGKYVGQFDVIQCRSVAKHVPSAADLTRNIGKALRTGGVFIFADACTPVYNDNMELWKPALPELTYEDSLDQSWFTLWLAEVSARWLSKAKENTDGDKLHILMGKDGQFGGIDSTVYNSPIGWDGADLVKNGKGAEIGKLMTLNCIDFLESSRPLLLSSGLPENVVDTWSANTRREAQDSDKKLVMKWAFSWGTKRVAASL